MGSASSEQKDRLKSQKAFQLRRRMARSLALQFIFQMDIRKETSYDQEELARFQATWLQDEEQRKAWKYAQKIIQGTYLHLPDIDRCLQEAASNWTLSRMSYMDRSIMRMAVFEIAFAEKKLPVVAINEAVELAKTYSDAGAAAFVNGILDKVRKNCSV